MVVRKKTVEWLSVLSNDDICDFLPQLVQVNIDIFKESWRCSVCCYFGLCFVVWFVVVVVLIKLLLLIMALG